MKGTIGNTQCASSAGGNEGCVCTDFCVTRLQLLSNEMSYRASTTTTGPPTAQDSTPPAVPSTRPKSTPTTSKFGSGPADPRRRTQLVLAPTRPGGVSQAPCSQAATSKATSDRCRLSSTQRSAGIGLARHLAVTASAAAKVMIARAMCRIIRMRSRARIGLSIVLECIRVLLLVAVAALIAATATAGVIAGVTVVVRIQGVRIQEAGILGAEIQALQTRTARSQMIRASIVKALMVRPPTAKPPKTKPPTAKPPTTKAVSTKTLPTKTAFPQALPQQPHPRRAQQARRTPGPGKADRINGEKATGAGGEAGAMAEVGGEEVEDGTRRRGRLWKIGGSGSGRGGRGDASSGIMRGGGWVVPMREAYGCSYDARASWRILEDFMSGYCWYFFIHTTLLFHHSLHVLVHPQLRRSPRESVIGMEGRDIRSSCSLVAYLSSDAV